MKKSMKRSPVINPEFLDRALFRDNSGTCSGRDLLRAALNLSAALPDCRYIINDCQDRYHFTVLLLASVTQGIINLFPANRTHHILSQLQKTYADTVLISDTDDMIEKENAVSIISLLSEPSDNLLNNYDEIPKIDKAQIISIAFTSGSTGNPQPYERSWDFSASEAIAAGDALGIDKECKLEIVGTTPAQHMYGYVTSIFIPLQYGLCAYRRHLLFPEDIREALQLSQFPAILVTTPSQIRACVLEKTNLPKMRMILSSAAPLPKKIAAQAEQLFTTPVNEFYGSTETGAIALRRLASQEKWRTFRDIEISAKNQKLLVNAPWFQQPMQLNDLVKITGQGEFLLLGRDSDMIKIAGKRCSLQDLNHLLTGINGVKDGTFIVPDANGSREIRLTAFVVAPTMTAAQIIKELECRIDPVFLPRPLRLVDSLPRTATGKLPRAHLLNMMKRETAK